MARYTGPKTKIARKFGVAIFGEDKSFEKRNYPPVLDLDNNCAHLQGSRMGVFKTVNSGLTSNANEASAMG